MQGYCITTSTTPHHATSTTPIPYHQHTTPILPHHHSTHTTPHHHQFHTANSVSPIPPPHTTHRHTTTNTPRHSTPHHSPLMRILVLVCFLIVLLVQREGMCYRAVSYTYSRRGGYGACLIIFFFWGAKNIVVGFLRKLFLPDIMYTQRVYTGGKYYLMGEKPYAEPIYIWVYCCSEFRDSGRDSAIVG